MGDQLPAVLQRYGHPVVFLFQPRLHLTIDARIEDFGKNLLPLPGGSVQQAQIIALRDHGDLGKLAVIHADQLLQLLVDLPDAARIFRPVRKDQAGLRRHLHRGIFAVFVFSPAQTQIGGAASYLIALPLLGKNERHEGLPLIRRVLASHHASVPLPAAALPEQCEGDGVKNGGFSRAGISGDQENPVVCPFKVHRRLSRIGAEGGHGDL